MAMNKITLDSWAILAWLQGESSGRLVKDLLNWPAGDWSAVAAVARAVDIGPESPELFLSVVSLGEVFCLVGRRFGETAARETVRRIRALPLTIVPAGEAVVLEAARLMVTGPVSYAGAFAAATAQATNSVLVTGDPGLRALPALAVHWIGR